MSVRVRIAPSPTGDPHVGTAYIALLNWCFARKHGGRFVLRIEDTDQERCSEASRQAIIDALHWLGLDYDEGPLRGGEYGPYVQSERVAAGIYREHAERLIDQGDAYPCFCSPAILNDMREAQRQASEPIMYDRRCRALRPEEAAERRRAGEPHVIRMAAPLEGEHSYQDRLRPRPVCKPWGEIDDQVLIKSDGWPTYHLAAVVDDHLMGITHVIRAEEWLNSLPKHTWLNERLGFSAPEYVHVGLLRNADKSKISKRKNPTNLLWYRDEGYLPAAMLNFLALLGHSHPDGEERFDRDELLRIFDLDRLSVAGPVFDLAKLDHLQGLYFRDLSDEALKQAIHEAIDYRLDALLPQLRPRMTRGGDFVWRSEFLFREELALGGRDCIPKGWDAATTRAALQALEKTLKKALKARDFSWQAEALEASIRQLVEERGLKPKPFFMAIRMAVAGRPDTPPLFDTLELIGQTKVMKRLAAAMASLRD